MNTSLTPLVSLATRLLASLSKTTYRPSVEMTGETEFPFPPPTPVWFTLTRVVTPFVRLRRKTSTNLPLSSFVTRLLAELRKRTKRPSELMTDPEESLFPPAATGSEESASEIAWTVDAAWISMVAAHARPSNPAMNRNNDKLFTLPSLGCMDQYGYAIISCGVFDFDFPCVRKKRAMRSHRNDLLPRLLKSHREGASMTERVAANPIFTAFSR